MSCFDHAVAFQSAAVQIKSLTCSSPCDPVGFDHEYEASRISLVRSGAFARVINGSLHLADSTQVLFVNRGDVHRFLHPIHGGDSCTVLEPSPATLSELHWHFAARAPRFPIHQGCSSHSLARAHDALLHLVAARDHGDLGIEEAALDLCGRLFVLAFHRRSPYRTGRRRTTERRQRQLAYDVGLILNLEFRRPPGLNDLADRVGCSAFHLSRVFRAQVGVSLRGYVGQQKAWEGARRIVQGDTDFASLALDLGYCDQSHFTNAFTKFWGMTPSGFRRRWRAANRAISSKRRPGLET